MQLVARLLKRAELITNWHHARRVARRTPRPRDYCRFRRYGDDVGRRKATSINDGVFESFSSAAEVVTMFVARISNGVPTNCGEHLLLRPRITSGLQAATTSLRWHLRGHRFLASSRLSRLSTDPLKFCSLRSTNAAVKRYFRRSFDIGILISILIS